MTTNPHDFDLLDEWALRSDADIEKIISDDSIAALQRIVHLLGDEAQSSKIVVIRDNFVPLVREMRTLKHDGSRALGDAILEASDLLDQHEPAKAREVYERFLSSCSSKFYRDIARNRLKSIP